MTQEDSAIRQGRAQKPCPGARFRCNMRGETVDVALIKAGKKK